MVVELAEKDMLPCIVFCNNRIMCEKSAKGLLQHIMNKKIKLKKSSSNKGMLIIIILRL